MTTTTATDISSTNTQSNQKGEGIVSLTVGKVDASIALLTTDDHLIIEFPTILLPEDIKTGSIVQFNVSHNYESESNVFTKFLNLQNDIFQKYGQLEPSPPHLSKLNVTQTSCILKWDNLNLGSVDLKSLILYKSTIKPENANSGSSIPDNAQSSTGAATHTKMERITMIPNPIKTNSFKISGLSVDTSYEFQLKMSTTSGTYYSNRLAIKTHKMTDMSGITCCLGKLDTTLQITENDIKSCLDSIGAKPLQNKVTIDTTHYITNEVDEVDNDQDEELEKAKRNNIPIVKPEWVRACQVEKRIIGVRGFYYQNPVGGADDMTGNYKFDKSLTEAYLSKISAEEKTETGKDQEAVTEVQKENKMEEEEENNIEKEDKASSGNSEQEGGLEDKDFKTEDLNEELTTDNEQSKEQKEDVLKNDKKIKAVDLNDQQEDEDEEGKYENIIEQAGKEEKSMEEPMVEEGKEGEPVEETKDEGPVGGNNEESVGGNNEEPIEENKGEEEELMGENKENPVEGNREEPVKEEPVKEEPVEEEPVEEEPVEEEPVEEEPVEEEPVEEEPVEEEPVEEEPMEEEPMEEELVEEEPVEEEPVEEEPTEETKEEPVEEEPIEKTKEEPIEENKEEEPVDEEPVDEEPVEEEPTEETKEEPTEETKEEPIEENKGEEPVEEETMDEEPVDEEPVDEEPVEEKPTEENKVEEETLEENKKEGEIEGSNEEQTRPIESESLKEDVDIKSDLPIEQQEATVQDIESENLKKEVEATKSNELEETPSANGVINKKEFEDKEPKPEEYNLEKTSNK